MADRGRNASLKRPLPDDDDDDDDESVGKHPAERKVRFPKGKKAKNGGEVTAAAAAAVGPSAAGGEDEAFGQWMSPELAAKERARRRNKIREDELLRDPAGGGGFQDISRAEVYYEVNANFEDDGIEVEPFNLNREREEGYFDAAGNFVEYINKNEIKDAWLDSIDVDSKFVGKSYEKTVNEEDFQDLTSEDIGKIKRSIANVLQPGETVIQALKRLKGTSNDKKERMSEDTKRTFDKLTEDAMRLMENGDYNVYHEKQETFEREAEGYERLARTRDGNYRSAVNGSYESTTGEDIFSQGTGLGAQYLSTSDLAPGELGANSTTAQVSSADDGENFDIFGDEDESASINPNSDGIGSSSTSEPFSQSASEGLNTLQNLDPEKAKGGGSEIDYVFDESSGYYYSSSLGYYYDSASGLYCSAMSGKWYSYSEQTGSYDEIQDDGSQRISGVSEV